ncbi:hypothetical protein [Methanobacterium spitsbergense]|uniref:Uncharacterized protein n=1 Tax=Methanobacterium spitsbergense TaxID=2874285 RepID=A0A8T5V528_9EURY|nr:hypothetical protein [Methanobacterium spitsbergense]MBZ2166775.1 hypothetical protein [Methanobacterium spitsbergense]
MDDKKTTELMAKCEAMKDDPTLMKECKDMLETMVEKRVEMEDESGQTYTNMVENISAEDVPNILVMALKIARNDKIKDPEIKNAAERLIRTLEPL